MKQNTGFTLVEILTAVVIITILVAMAAPLYEKTIERSRMAEARTILAKLQDAKLFAMDNMGCFAYKKADSCPTLRHLNVAFTPAAAPNYSFDTDDFHYSLFPVNEEAESETPWWENAVCAKRKGGDYKDTVFLYAAPGVVDANSVSVGSNQAAQFLCFGTHCTDYGQENASTNENVKNLKITCDE